MLRYLQLYEAPFVTNSIVFYDFIRKVFLVQGQSVAVQLNLQGQLRHVNLQQKLKFES